jgi:hypothetical protein
MSGYSGTWRAVALAGLAVAANAFEPSNRVSDPHCEPKTDPNPPKPPRDLARNKGKRKATAKAARKARKVNARKSK